MEDSIDIPVPARKWALCAIDDLTRAGYRAELLQCRGDDDPWTIRVSGPAEGIAEIRDALQVPAPRLCWESFVNEAMAG